MMLRLICILTFSVLFFAPVRAQDASSLDVLRARFEALETRLQNKQAPVDEQNLALLKFKIEQAQLLFDSLESNEAARVLSSPYDETKTAIATLLTRAESIARARGDAVYPSLSTLHERAYIAPADGSAQPYWVFVPRDYTPRKQWPLVVFLHGYSPDISKIRPWLPGAEIWQAATNRGFIMAVPYGRRNSDFVGVGEDDTLAVTDAVSSRYNVDADRTFLMGPSMGGFGVHAIGLHHPDRFAAIAPMCARTDFYLWFNLERENVPFWKQVLYDADNPRSLRRNAAALPIFMQHGELDTIVPAEHSRRFYADLKALNSPVFYREIAGASHYIYWEYATFEIALDWMKKLKRAPAPRRVEYSSGALRNNSSYWVSIESFEDYARMAHIAAEIKADNVVEVQTENVASFELRPPPEFLQADLPITLLVNGKEANGKFPVGKPLRYLKAAGTIVPKNPRRAGPIKDVLRDPFLLVYGTLKDDEDEKLARHFLQEWSDYADGLPPIKADKDVTDDDKKDFNLVLFGTRQSHSLLREISDKLPLELTPTGYRLGDREYSSAGQTLGAQLCYPSPFNDERMIVVQSGLGWGAALPVNHKLDLLPEWIVYDETIDASDQTNRALAAGFFDDNWQLMNVERPTPNIERPTENAEVPTREAAP